jgi:hypothetical protein
VTDASIGVAGPVPGPAETAGPVLTVPGAPLAFHVMAKPTGAACNLDCEYCFFLSKEIMYPGSRFRMAADLQETYLRQLPEAHARAPEVAVAPQGGEPTMTGLDFFRRAIDLERKYAQPGQRGLNTIQTNGTCRPTSRAGPGRRGQPGWPEGSPPGAAAPRSRPRARCGR